MNDLQSFEIREGHTKNDRYFKGSIHRYALHDHLEFYGFDLKGIHKFSIYLKSANDTDVYVCFNLAAKSSLALKYGLTGLSIPPFCSVIITEHHLNTISLTCEPQKHYDFLLLKIQQEHLNADQLSILSALQKDGCPDASGSPIVLPPNLELCEMARKLKQIDKTSPENQWIAMGYSHILIGLKLKEALNVEPKPAFLRSFEIQQLEVLSREIKAHPQYQYSIKELCKKTGLSVSKLQLGFKEMHHCTVAIFIRNQRLEKALELLNTTDLNISEIVYSVGLTSRSYFCRIFKKRFKCSPKFYQQQLRDPHVLVS